jgi:hypothetical protein
VIRNGRLGNRCGLWVRPSLNVLSFTPEARLKALILALEEGIVACGGKAKDEWLGGGGINS